MTFNIKSIEGKNNFQKIKNCKGKKILEVFDK